MKNIMMKNKIIKINEQMIQRILFLIVVGYLIVALLLPLCAIVMKSFQSYQFNLSTIYVSIDQGDGFIEEEPLSSWMIRSNYKINDGLYPTERTRERVVNIVPKKARSNASLFKVENRFSSGELIENPSLIMFRGEIQPINQPWIISKDEIGKVYIVPSKIYSLDNFIFYTNSKELFGSIARSFWIAISVVIFVIPIAFLFAFALTRTNIPFKSAFKLLATVPILAPSLLPAIGLVYLFGKQGIATFLLMGNDIYGPLGIILASIFFTFPHALIILLIALANSDQRLYEAAEVLGASKFRIFMTVTIPSVRYGLISACFVVFTLVLTDFSVVKVIGGNFNVLALDIYKQVVGQQNFQIGAVLSIILLVPAVIAFMAESYVGKRQTAQVTAKATSLQIKTNRSRDIFFFTVCFIVSSFIMSMILICQFASLVKFWPYNFSLGLSHYDFSKFSGSGWSAYFNSLKIASLTGILGTSIIFLGAYLLEKTKQYRATSFLMQLLAVIPMAVPGMVLGLAYIFFFNSPNNPLNCLYGTLSILVIVSITHLYTVPHITATTALKQMDKEFESVSASLKQPFWKLLFVINIPVCLPAILEIMFYLFVNTMTTVSAVVFLYSPNTNLASVAMLNMDDAGDTAVAAAMGMMIFYTNVLLKLGHIFLIHQLEKRQIWRHKR